MNIDLAKALKQIQALVDEIVTQAPNAVVALVVLVIFYLIGKYAGRLILKVSKKAHWERGAGVLIGHIAHYSCIVFGVLVALSIVVPSFSMKDLVQVLGIGGVAIGFAFKDVFQNFLAGVMILVGRPFRIGDQIQVKGYDGIVEDIQVRATKIRTAENKLVVIPNTTLYTAEVTVVTHYEKLKTSYDLQILYKEDIAKAIELALGVLTGCAEIEENPMPSAFFSGVQELHPVITLNWWTASQGKQVLAGKVAVLPRLQQALGEAKIALPVPEKPLETSGTPQLTT